MLRAAIVVAIASPAFTVCVVHHSVAVSPRNVIGGHLPGVVAGSVCSSLLWIPEIGTSVQEFRLIFDVIAALSVGLGTLIMLATNTEHPPAAGSALGLVVHGWNWHAVGFIMIGAVELSAVRAALWPRMVNLL